MCILVLLLQDDILKVGNMYTCICAPVMITYHIDSCNDLRQVPSVNTLCTVVDMDMNPVSIRAGNMVIGC